VFSVCPRLKGELNLVWQMGGIESLGVIVRVGRVQSEEWGVQREKVNDL
jgi:hypothetical protein